MGFIVSFITLLIFIFGSYYFLFHYYERTAKEYYGSLMKNLSSFQQLIIRKESYWEDLKNISISLKDHKGVNEVWCTDRFGKLIFHTEKDIFEEYKSKRLPSGYYESISHIWKFQNGYPEINIRRPEGWFFFRLSIPIYAFGREDYDFVLGMDVKRFIFLPEKTNYILLSAGGYVVISLLLLFFPLFLWFRSCFNGIISQARLVIGSIQLEAETERGTQTAEETGTEEFYSPGIDEVEEKNTSIKVEVTENTEEKREIEIGNERIKSSKEAEKIEEKMKTNPLMVMMDKKQSLFRKQDIDLPFIQASSFIYHSKSSNGSYLSYNKNNSYHLYSIFSYPDVNIEFAVDQLTEIAEYFESEMSSSPQSSDILKALNNYCLENNLHLGASTVVIGENERKVEYTSCGKTGALYIKHNEEVVKDLKLDIPGLGTLSEEEFEEAFSYAEIDFTANDIFILLPQNAPDILIEEEYFIDLIKNITLAHKESSAREIGNEINNIIKPFRRKEKKIPETGFAVLKFL